MCTVLKFKLRASAVDHSVVVVQADVRDPVRHLVDGHALPHGVGRRGPPISTAELKRRSKDFMMRWHPDKWIGRKLCEENRERIMRDVTNVFRRIDQEKHRNGL